MKSDLDDFEFQIMNNILDSTNKAYINNIINKLKAEKDIDIPIYYYNKGLPIGNMTSQFLSIYYLHKLDYFIVHNLHLKYYIRYMDDFIILDEDLEKLKKAKEIIIDKLENEYKLKVNIKKTWISNIKYGFSFLGYTYKVIDNKTIIRIKKSNLEKIKKRIKENKYLLNNKKKNFYSAFCSIMTYSNCYKFSDNYKIYKLISRYWYNEK